MQEGIKPILKVVNNDKKILFVKPRVNKGTMLDPLICAPPLGLIYLSAFLKAKGYSQIKIVHMDAEGMTFEHLKKIINEYNPAAVGISAMTAESSGMYQVADIAKKNSSDTLVVVGGPYPTACPEASLNSKNIDIVVQGEGEETLLEIIKGEPFNTIKNIYFRNNGQVIKTGRGEYIDNLDQLPYPDWDAIPLDRYKNLQPQSVYLYKQRYMPLFTSRGCPFTCSFCHNVFGRRFRAHSAQRVFEEIKILHDKYGINNFEILDDIFNLDKMRTINIMKAIIDSRLKIKLFFTNGLRVDLLDEEILDLFERAGVRYISVAIETASLRLQKELGKNVYLKKVKQIIAYMSKRKIIVNGFFMLGFPSETLSEIASTIKFAITSNLHTASFFLVQPFEGTALAEIARKRGKKIISSSNKSYYYYLVSKTSANCSEFSNLQLKIIFSIANILFYCNPFRIAGIIRRLPDKRALKLLIMNFFLRIFQLA